MSENIIELGDAKRNREGVGRLEFLEQLLSEDEPRARIFDARGPLRFNQLKDRIELGGEPLRIEEDTLFGWRIKIAIETEDKMGKELSVGADTLAAAIAFVARKNAHHPVEEWLRALVWDGVDRLSAGLPSAFGVTPGTIQATFLRLTMRALVARAVRPGCQVDTVLVLVGAQGVGKSRALRALGGDWFADPHMDFSNKDSWCEVHRHWLLEFAELNAIRKAADLEEVKAFVTRSTDNYRDPYGRNSFARDRRSLFIGTTNNREFLSDPTGHRRWWPVEIVGKIDREWIGANREQIFAQALSEVDSGAQWHLTEAEEIQHAESVQSHVEIDPWNEALFDWMHDHQVSGVGGVKLSKIIEDVTKIEVRHIHSGHMRRMAALMRLNGARRSKDNNSRDWFW